MPANERILGFGNIWYESAIISSRSYELPGGAQIRLIDPVHFLATKLEAHAGRGDHDFVMSHDLEDLVCVLDGTPELEDEIEGAAGDVREYVCSRVRDLLKDARFRETLAGHLPGDPGSQARLPNLVGHFQNWSQEKDRLRAFSYPVFGVILYNDPYTVADQKPGSKPVTRSAFSLYSTET